MSDIDAFAEDIVSQARHAGEIEWAAANYIIGYLRGGY